MSAVISSEKERGQLLKLKEQLCEVIAGKEERIDLMLMALVCGGHILIEDVPGVGKTTLARAMAASLGTDFGRIQFTADLLPADITGIEMYEPEERRFVFHQGPLFHHIVLADEINRATPKAQSALLEAMAEGTVSIERDTYPLPDPFFVIATQNPMEFAGTFPLPESQLDRFFMRITLGYPDADAERRLLIGHAGRLQLEGIKPLVTVGELADIRKIVSAMPVSDVLLDYVLRLLELSRDGTWLRQGVSPRGGQDLLAAGKARAWFAGQAYVSAADIQSVWLPVVAHRVVADGDASKALQTILEQVPVPA